MLGKVAVGALAIAAVVAAASLVPEATPADRHTSEDAVVLSFDGTGIAITVFRPAGSSADAPVPLVLRGHGWSLTRDTEIAGTVSALLDAGYGVVTFDARGHGGSEGLARVHDPDFEIKDVSALLDWIHDNLAWVAAESGKGHDRDVLVGGSGGSYGGGWQLLAAEHDGRLDALVPEITWHSLPQSLVPNGAPKSDWIHLLYGAAKVRTRLHPDVDAWYREIMLTNEVPPDALAHFEASSAYPLGDRLATPTLLVQGMSDMLFNFNEALATYRLVEANGAPARIVTHLNGHLINPSYVDGRLPDPRFPQRGAQGSPCGDASAHAIAWYDRWLKGLDVEEGAAVSFALEDGTCVALDAVPEPSTVARSPGGALPAEAGSIALPLLTASEETVLAGVPTLRVGSALVAGVDDILYASLVVVPREGDPRVVDAQTVPLRLAGPGATNATIDLGGIATRLAEGDELLLRLDRVNEFYFTNSGRLPSAIVLRDVEVGLPVVAGVG